MVQQPEGDRDRGQPAKGFEQEMELARHFMCEHRKALRELAQGSEGQ